MTIETFINNFANQFEETNIAEFKEDTNYKDLEEWSSLIALLIIAMVDENYNVRLKGEDIRTASSILDLFNIIKSRV